MRLLIASAASALVFGAAALAETREVDVRGFSAVDAANGVTVEITLGADVGVTVEGPAGQIDDVLVDVQGGVLRIRPERAGWFRRTDVSDTTVHVSVQDLSRVHAANGAMVSLTGAGEDSVLELYAENGGMLDAAGACASLDARATRGGMLSAEDLACGSVVVDASMGGMAEVHANLAAEASASMGGMVSLAGEAEEVSSSSSLGGSVSRSQ